jgi:hypothetical protein
MGLHHGKTKMSNGKILTSCNLSIIIFWCPTNIPTSLPCPRCCSQEPPSTCILRIQNANLVIPFPPSFSSLITCSLAPHNILSHDSPEILIRLCTILCGCDPRLIMCHLTCSSTSVPQFP